MIPHNRPTLGFEESAAAERVIESGWLAQGREVQAFENELCALLGLPEGHAVAVSSGTAALFLALWVLDAAGSEVGCPVYACSALTNAIALAAATPILLDTRRNSPSMDVDALRRCKADIAIVPHMFGLPVDLRTVAGKRIIEDCAQALGAQVGNNSVGLTGAVSVFSFYATKLITSGGQGGMLASRDRALADGARDYREFDCRHDRKPRFNFQMTDLQATVGREQLRKLPWFLRRRHEIFERYRAAGLDLVDDAPCFPVRYRSVLRAKDPRWLIDQLKHRDIAAIVPVEDWELLGAPEDYPQAMAFARSTVSLPIYPSLSDGELGRIIAALQELDSKTPLSRVS
ncbi:MAG TPA: DegT/DnrJ/EryC1/StrS family aminotransferase [Xanthobacteraceae bacterium]|jgi:perosamine synthetase